ncbi:hypothetical protein BTUL_0242g00110 [Botrytis tulipae]|uniref:Uncharacterized protein n=1 Tax=Botrytis tulipae TaxID=87230 RepID=A0A4Z1E736_9HELO|nr:hypothetical protein BTUL_0242g00110 [Botrytis tulipae]
MNTCNSRPMMVFPKPHSADHLVAILTTKIATRDSTSSNGDGSSAQGEEPDGGKDLEGFLNALDLQDKGFKGKII